jgi:hypothetical protein
LNRFSKLQFWRTRFAELQGWQAKRGAEKRSPDLPDGQITGGAQASRSTRRQRSRTRGANPTIQRGRRTFALTRFGHEQADFAAMLGMEF